MSQTLSRVRALVRRGSVRVSDHGYEELSSDGIRVREIVEGVDSALVVEDYPEFPKGPCVLVRERDGRGDLVHVVWGIPRGETEPAVIVTAYRPDPARWSTDCMRRR